MHATQHSINNFARKPGFIGTAGMCPSLFERSHIIENSAVQILNISNKKIKSDLSYFDMT
ncbi:MAG: hypothetical protein ACC653_03895 [Gammaproteobacteria bacterium]